MSVEAITWALKQPVSQSSTKFVLVALANCADGRSFECYPSIAYLCDATSQNRKTVIDNIRRLVDDGYIIDTGERRGRTASIKQYRLNVGAVPKPVRLKHPENGTAKESQKRDYLAETVPETELLSDTETGTTQEEAVPFSDGSSPVFGHEAVPKTGHGTVSEPSTNRQEDARECASPPPAAAKPKTQKQKITFRTFAERTKAEGQELIPGDDPIFRWAEDVGLPDGWLLLVWQEFRRRYRESDKRYADWRQVFRNAVRGNWFRFWWADEDGRMALTTVGITALRAYSRQETEAVT